mgnify:CR=1 FL=1
MDISKLLVILGAVLLFTGLALMLGYRGLPGEIAIQRKNYSFYFPIATSILLSLLLTLAFYIFRR